MEPADRGERKRRGAWYTPPALVRFLVEQAVVPAALEAGGASGLRVLDPACGDGRILAAAQQAVANISATGQVELDGIELDAAVARQARTALPSARIVVGDGRCLEPGGSFDVVVGNPPYLSQLARSTSRRGRSRLGGGPYADVAAEFLLRAVELARPDGGRIALVLPLSILASRDTEAVRQEVSRRAAITGLWLATGPVFDAAVNVCVVLARRGVEQRPVRRWSGRDFDELRPAPAAHARGATWSPLIADALGAPPVELDESAGCVGELASATAGFRAQYYGLVPHVDDGADGPPLVTTGLIDVGACAWGRRPARFARRTRAAPRVDMAGLAASEPAVAAWVQRQLRPKVLVATQTRVLEAVVDEAGAWVPSVPVIAVHPHRPEDLWALGAVLIAPPVAAWAAARHLGVGLAATALKLSARQVLQLPLPRRPWTEAVERLRHGDLEGCAVAMCAAYGLGEEAAAPVLAWWRAGAALGPHAGALAAADR